MHAASYIAVSTTILTAAAAAQPDYGLDFVTIGDVDNPDADPAIYPTITPPQDLPPAGGVDYQYRIMRSPVRAGDWLEFAQAYWPHNNIPDDPFYLELLGWNIRLGNPSAGPDDDPQMFLLRGNENYAATGSWNALARYANWLHNGKVHEAWAFHTGVYDIASGIFPQRSPDAKFWIPDIHEWNKAVYWDPDKNGPGDGGYWTQPNGTDTPLIAGPPGVGERPSIDGFGAIELGSYPDTQTPWGLQDVSGHDYEIVEGRDINGYDTVYGLGSRNDFQYQNFDHIGLGFWSNQAGATDFILTFRLAAAVPSPASAMALLVGLAPVLRRKRNEKCTDDGCPSSRVR